MRVKNLHCMGFGVDLIAAPKPRILYTNSIKTGVKIAPKCTLTLNACKEGAVAIA